MKKQKIKNLFKLGILFLGICLSVWNCEKKEDDHLINSDLQNKNKSISKVSLDDILKQHSFSKKQLGIKSKEQLKFSKTKFNSPSYKITSSKGLSYLEDEKTIYVFPMRRTDEKDNYFYNLVIKKTTDKIEKYIYKYPKNKTESISVSKIHEGNFSSNKSSILSKTSRDCVTHHYYSIIPCPCVGHIDPYICLCPIRPIWRYNHSQTICTSLESDPDIEEPDPDSNNDPDISSGITAGDGCFRNSEGLTECPPADETPEIMIPNTPLPILKPDLEDYSITSILDLTNLQKDWLEKLENQNFKSDIEDFLNQYALSVEFNNATLFAQQAIEAWILNRDTEVDFDELYIPYPTPDDNYVYQGTKSLIPNPLVLANGDEISITFGTTTSDDINANQEVSTDLIDGMKFAFEEANSNLPLTDKITSIYIMATTNGKHSSLSNHYKSTAVDISRINGRKMALTGVTNQIIKVQEAFDNFQYIRENFGPYFKHKFSVEDPVGSQWDYNYTRAGDHSHHIHISTRR